MFCFNWAVGPSCTQWPFNIPHIDCIHLLKLALPMLWETMLDWMRAVPPGIKITKQRLTTCSKPEGINWPNLYFNVNFWYIAACQKITGVDCRTCLEPNTNIRRDEVGLPRSLFWVFLAQKCSYFTHAFLLYKIHCPSHNQRMALMTDLTESALRPQVWERWSSSCVMLPRGYMLLAVYRTRCHSFWFKLLIGIFLEDWSRISSFCVFTRLSYWQMFNRQFYRQSRIWCFLALALRAVIQAHPPN